VVKLCKPTSAQVCHLFPPFVQVLPIAEPPSSAMFALEESLHNEAFFLSTLLLVMKHEAVDRLMRDSILLRNRTE